MILRRLFGRCNVASLPRERGYSLITKHMKAPISKIIQILRRETKKRGYEIPIEAASRIRFNSPFEILVTVLLTAQTKDALVARMLPDIFSNVRGPKDLVRLSETALQKLIYPVSFYRNKSKALKKLGKILLEQHGGKVPHTHAELIALPGIGEKTAHIVMHRVFEKHVGIGVDVHVHRISNRIGYIRTRTPHETEMRLQKILPKKYWKDYNSLLVKWGQNICRPTSPKCSECVLRPYCARVGVTRSR